MKRLDSHSQYFLRSPDTVKMLLGHTRIKKSDTVLDIGAGSGVISSVLARRVNKVIAVELDPRMAGLLQKNLAEFPNVTVVNKDFMTMPLPNGKYAVFANIPFHLSSAILQRLTDTPTPATSINLIVQKQFARKLLIDSADFTGMLGALIAPRYEARIRKPLRKTDYMPAPNVDTVLLEIRPRPQPLLPYEAMERYGEMIRQAYDKPIYFAKLPLAKAGVAGGEKPSQLMVGEWVSLFQLSQS